MKYAILSAVILCASQVSAGEIGSSSLAAIGLSEMAPMSDSEGLKVRAKFINVNVNTISLLPVAGVVHHVQNSWTVHLTTDGVLPGMVTFHGENVVVPPNTFALGIAGLLGINPLVVTSATATSPHVGFSGVSLNVTAGANNLFSFLKTW